MTFGISAATAITAGSAALGAYGSYQASKNAGKPQTSTSEPWAAQQPYLKTGFGHAQDSLDSALNMGVYNGQRVADLNPMQTAGADFAGTYAQRYGMPAAGALADAGTGFIGNGSRFAGNAGDIYGRASGDPTQSIISNAGAYANNPYVDAMIASANRDTSRQLNEQDLPGLARVASGTGNTNSTRAGVESAIMQRGAADRMADTAANIRSTLFSKGLDMSQGQYNANLDNMLRSNNGLLQAFQQGGNTILQGQQVAGNSFDATQAAGGLYAGHDQATLDAAQAAFNAKQNNALDLTGKYQGIIGGNYGSTTTTSGNGGGSPWASALQGGIGAGMAGYGTFGKLGGFNTAPVAPSGYGMGWGNYDTGTQGLPTRGGG